jgi:hypothetical protein
MTARLLWALPVLCVACGDNSHATGALGRATYTLHTDYALPGQLTDHRILTSHAQTLAVGLTDRGAKRADFPGRITHTVDPPAGVTLSFDPGDPEDEDAPAPDLVMSVDNPGTYTIETWYEGDVLDYLALQFAKPENYDVVSWVKLPGEDDFENRTAANEVTVDEGTQLALVAIPMKDGERLAGDFDLTVSHTPEWAAVTVHNVLGVYEDEGVWGDPAATSLVFVDPATVTVTLTDEPNGVSAEQVYNVVDQGALEAP